MATRDDIDGWWRRAQPKFERHLKRHAPTLDHDDFLQELAMMLIVKMKDINDEKHFINWSFQALSWNLLDHIKRQSVERREKERILNKPKVEEEVEANRIRDIDLSLAISRLEERDQIIINDFLQGYTSTEIGKRIGLSERGSRAALAKAKMKLIEHLGVDG